MDMRILVSKFVSIWLDHYATMTKENYNALVEMAAYVDNNYIYKR